MAKKAPEVLSESENNSIREYLATHNLKFENLVFPKPQAARLLEIIKKLQGSDSQGFAELRHIIALAELTGIDKYKAEEMVNKLRLAGELIETSSERFRIVV